MNPWHWIWLAFGVCAFGFYASRQPPPPPKIQVVKTIAIPFKQFVHRGEMK